MTPRTARASVRLSPDAAGGVDPPIPGRSIAMTWALSLMNSMICSKAAQLSGQPCTNSTAGWSGDPPSTTWIEASPDWTWRWRRAWLTTIAAVTRGHSFVIPDDSLSSRDDSSSSRDDASSSRARDRVAATVPALCNDPLPHPGVRSAALPPPIGLLSPSRASSCAWHANALLTAGVAFLVAVRIPTLEPPPATDDSPRIFTWRSLDVPDGWSPRSRFVPRRARRGLLRVRRRLAFAGVRAGARVRDDGLAGSDADRGGAGFGQRKGVSSKALQRDVASHGGRAQRLVKGVLPARHAHARHRRCTAPRRPHRRRPARPRRRLARLRPRLARHPLRPARRRSSASTAPRSSSP